MTQCLQTTTKQTISQLRAGRQQRCEKFQQIARDLVRTVLHPDGSWTIPLTKEFGRLDLQIATAFYLGDKSDHVIANQLTCRAPMSQINGHLFGIFNTSIMLHHLVRFDSLMDRKTRQRCEKCVRSGCSYHGGMPATDFQFHGYNDNMPAMAVKTLILAGERFNEKNWIDMGLWKLRRFAEILSRCGMIGEYNSPNYMPDTIHNLGTLHAYTQNDEVREYTDKIIRRLWVDLASHWHSAARCPAGPFSRAYLDDFNNYISPLNCLCWFLFGKEVSGITAYEAVQPRSGLECIHGNDPYEHTTRMTWYSTTDDSLLDDKIADLFVKKPYPYDVIASAEQGNTDQTPLKTVTLTTHIREAYSLGTASSGFLNGKQTANLYVTGNNHDDISPVLYTRYLLNETYPGNTADNVFHHRTHGEDNIHSFATAVTVQHQNSALLSMVPYRELCEQKIASLRMGIIAPDAVGQFGGFVNAAGKALRPNRAYTARAWYGARLGDAFVAMRPLAYSVMDLPKSKVILRQTRQYQYLEVVNYDDKPRTFTKAQLSMVLNGMAVELAVASDWDNDISTFIKAVSEAATFQDIHFGMTRRLRYHRQAMVNRPKLVLTLDYSTRCDGVAVRTINGRHAPNPTWQCTGIGESTLPLLSDDGYIAPPGVPWKNMFNPRCDGPWKISE